MPRQSMLRAACHRKVNVSQVVKKAPPAPSCSKSPGDIIPCTKMEPLVHPDFKESCCKLHRLCMSCCTVVAARRSIYIRDWIFVLTGLKISCQSTSGIVPCASARQAPALPMGSAREIKNGFRQGWLSKVPETGERTFSSLTASSFSIGF